MTVLSALDSAGRRRSPATMPGYHAGRPPRNRGMRYPVYWRCLWSRTGDVRMGVAFVSGPRSSRCRSASRDAPSLARRV
jgi:hypothetical protein